MVTLACLRHLGFLGLVAMSSLVGLLAAPMNPGGDDLRTIIRLAHEFLDLNEDEHFSHHPATHSPGTHSNWLLGTDAAAMSHTPTGSDRLKRGQDWFDPTWTPLNEIDPHTSHRPFAASTSSQPSVQPMPAGSFAGWHGSALDSRGVSTGAHVPFDETSHGGRQANLVDAGLPQMKAEVGPDVFQQGPLSASTSLADHSLPQSQQGLPRRGLGRPEQTETQQIARKRIREENLAEAREVVRQERNEADQAVLRLYGIEDYEAYVAGLRSLEEDKLSKLAKRVFSKDGMVSQAVVPYRSAYGAHVYEKLSMVYSTSLQREVYQAYLNLALKKAYRSGPDVIVEPPTDELPTQAIFGTKRRTEEKLQAGSLKFNPMLHGATGDLELGSYRLVIAPRSHGGDPVYLHLQVTAFPVEVGLPTIHMGAVRLPRPNDSKARRLWLDSKKQRASSTFV